MKKIIGLSIVALLCLFNQKAFAQQVPVANFTVSPNPICSGAVITIQDLSTNNPTSWSYTVAGVFPFPPPQVYTTQNPTLTFNGQGTFSITLIATNASGNSVPVVHTITVLPGANGNINPTNSNICLGSTNQASISVVTGGGPGGGGVNTYSWSNGSTATQIAVSPSVTTVYTCVISATNGCSVSRTATVNVTPATATISSNPANICPGTTSTLQISGSGPGPWTYTWSNSSNNNTITSNVATIVSATIQNNAGCMANATYNLGSSSTLSLTATSNPLALCAGGTASVFVSGATSYTWSNGTTTSNVIAVTPSATTVYSVFGAVGTCTGLTSYTLQVNHIPTITIVASATNVCAGATVSLTANGANNYTWTPGNFTTTSMVTPTLGTNTVFQVRGVNLGCTARINTIAITVAPSPVVNIVSSSTLACNGDIVSLTAFGANSYTWSTGGSGAVTIQSPSVTTTYSVVGASNNNCINTAAVTVSVNACTGLKETTNSNQQIVVYPNPSNGLIHIQSNYNGEFYLVNEFGQVLKSFTMDLNKNEKTIEGLNQGIYFILSKDQSIKQKIVIMP